VRVTEVPEEASLIFLLISKVPFISLNYKVYGKTFLGGIFGKLVYVPFV
jgi:hypothetical protein